jgi:hypothetical protein
LKKNIIIFHINDNTCWSRDNFIIVLYTLYNLKETQCINENLNIMLEKVKYTNSLCLKSLWQGKHLGYFERLRSITDDTVLHVYDLDLLGDVKIQIKKQNPSDKILLWPIVRLGVDFDSNYATKEAYRIYQQIDMKDQLTGFYGNSDNENLRLLGELLKGIL